MEPPSSLEPAAIRNEILKVFQSLRPIDRDEVRYMQPFAANTSPRRSRGRHTRGTGRGRRRSQFQYRDFCGVEILYRQLAVGRDTLLYPHRQKAAYPRDRSGDPFQADAPFPLLTQPGQPVLQPAGHPDPAGRGHPAEIRDEDSGLRI